MVCRLGSNGGRTGYLPAGSCCLEFLGFRELSHELLPIKTLRLVRIHRKGRRPAGLPAPTSLFPFAAVSKLGGWKPTVG
jgi:hypothetical protein